MKHKRKIINEFLSSYSTVQIGKDLLYWDENYKVRYGWNAKSDTYFAVNDFDKTRKFTLKQFHFYIKRLNKIKAFW